MAFAKTQTVKGDTVKYELNPEIKQYTLLDLGFTKTKNGNFVFRQSIDPNSPYGNKAIKLKITINSTMDEFKMSILDAKELTEIDLFSNDNHEDEQKQFRFLMQNMILRKAMKKA